MIEVVLFVAFAGGEDRPERVAPGTASVPDFHDAPSTFVSERVLVFTRSTLDFDRSSLWVFYTEESRAEPLSFSSPELRDSGGAWWQEEGTLYFTSGRSGAADSDRWSIWSVRRVDSGWSEPAPLPAPVNSSASECCPVVDDGWLYFASDRAGTWDVYRQPLDALSQGEPDLVEPVSTEHGEWPSFVSRRDGVLLLSSIRPGGPGGDDLWLARWAGENWSPPSRLAGAVNGTGYEDSAILSPDGRWLYFSSRPPEGDADVFRVRWRAIEQSTPEE
jgi:hypothetical protein